MQSEGGHNQARGLAGSDELDEENRRPACDASPDAGLNVRLLKERLEMEVGLLREGLRCMFFLALIVCFAMGFFLSTQPAHRAESRWYLDKRLEVGRIREVMDPESLFSAIMHVSSRVREVVPTSSEYVAEPLKKVLVGSIQSFPAGPVPLPPSRHPTMLLQWTVTTRLTLHNPDDPMPKKRLIIRSYPAGDTSGFSCWAWYSWGYDAFVFEYGRNILDDFYPVSVLRFNPTEINTDPAATNLVALLLNSTHVTVRLQDAGAVSSELYAGTVPSSCEGGTIEVGDLDISLGEMVVHSKRLTEVDLQEIEYSGKTLKEMAAGFTLPDPGSLVKETAMEAHFTTQGLITDYGDANLAVSKLTGSLAFLSAGNATAGEVNFMTGDTELGAALGRYPAPVNAATGLTLWNFSSPNEFWRVQGREELEVGTDNEEHRGLSKRLTAAFRALLAARITSFSLSWWTKGTWLPGWTELVFSDPSLPNSPPKLTVSQVFEEDAEGAIVSGFAVSFNGAPWCTSPQDEPCMKSPGFWCQGPDGISRYDGIWRHMGISFGALPSGSAEQSRLSTIELYVDGKMLCGLEFPLDDDLTPHFMSPDSSTFNYGVRDVELEVEYEDTEEYENEEAVSVLVRDMRLYHRRLTGVEYLSLARDPEFMECLDLDLVSDNSEWISEFGQSCADFSGLSEASSGGVYAPAACRSPEMKTNCPISCMHELNPVCFDGTLPVPRQGSLYAMLGSRMLFADLYLKHPEMGSEIRPLELPTKALQRLSQAGNWSRDRDGTWHRSFNAIRKLEYGTFVPSESGMRTLLSEGGSHYSMMFWMTSNDTSRINWCPGIGLDAAAVINASEENVEQHSLISGICRAEIQSQEIMKRMMAAGRTSMEVAQSSGWVGNGFIGDLLLQNQSSTIYFWAKTRNVQRFLSPRLSAIDGQQNICFVVQGATAWMQKRNLVSDFDGVTEYGTNRTAVKAFANRWKKGRLKIDAPAAAKENYKRNTWMFFALSIDYEQRVVRYTVNGIVAEKALPRGSWGCNSLEFLVATGSDMEISPVRVGKFSMSAGRLQRVYLSTREFFKNSFAGEEFSRNSRMTLVERSKKRYTQKIVALAPPIILQKRYGSSDEAELLCKGEVSSRYNERMKDLRGQQCKSPYFCPTRSQALTCMPPGVLKNSNSTERFFGRIPYPGGLGYPEFAWTLEGDVVVRDGVELRPAEEYIDENTQKIELILSFFVPAVQVATVLFASFDTTSIRVSVELDYLQIKLTNYDEFLTIVLWIFCGVVMAVISIVLALPAAYQELMEMLAREDMSWLSSFFRGYRVQDRNGKPIKLRVYSSNTTQPDILDVVLNLGMIFLMVSFLISKKQNYDEGTDTFASIAGIDWSGDETFQQKITNFLEPMGKVKAMVQTEEEFLTTAFWMLVLCCIRLIVYLRLHPRISAITETFASVGTELINFMFSFGIIFAFLAYIAHLTFGYLYEEFRSYEQSLITQFALLVGDSSPDYSNNKLMCLYVVGFVFICTLSLLNFLLAIVVNGYTAVTERVLENKVARSFFIDIANVPVDLYTWTRNGHRWPSKLALLQTMQQHYPNVFADEEEIVVSMSRDSFEGVVDQASRSRARQGDSDIIFERYASMRVLLVFPSDNNDESPSSQPKSQAAPRLLNGIFRRRSSSNS